MMSFGGFPLIQDLITKEGLINILNSKLKNPARQAKHSNSDVFSSLFYSFLSGGDCLEDINESSRELLQIKGFQCVSSDTAARRLKHWSEPNTVYTSYNHQSPITNTVNYASLVNNLIKIIAAKNLRQEGKTKGCCLDIDAHFAPSEKGDANYSYKKMRGYYPLYSCIGRHAVEVEVRNGNTAPSYRIKEHAFRVINKMKKSGVTIKEVRSDAAAYQYEFMDALNKKRIRFFIRAKNSKSLKEKALRLEYDQVVSDHNGEELYRWGEFAHRGYRIIVQREQTNDKEVNLLSNTLDHKYSYRMIITNDRRKKATGNFIIKHYNKRGDMERNFAFLRSDFSWKKLPFKKIKENATYMAVTALMSNLFEWVKLKLKEKVSFFKSVHIRLKKFLNCFAAVPAKWIKTAGQTFLVLYTDRDYSGLLTPK